MNWYKKHFIAVFALLFICISGMVLFFEYHSRNTSNNEQTNNKQTIDAHNEKNETSNRASTDDLTPSMPVSSKTQQKTKKGNLNSQSRKKEFMNKLNNNGLVSKSTVLQLVHKQWFQDLVADMVERGELKQYLSGYSKERLWEEISERTDIEPEDLPEDADVRTLSEDLVSALYNKKGVNSELAGQTRARVVFSTDVKSNNEPKQTRSVFGSDTVRIYACFEINNRDDDLKRVFVRWKNTSTGQINLFHRKRIEPDNAWDYVWIRKPEGWEPDSRYNVSIYGIGHGDGGLKLLGSGTYRITS